MELKILHLNIEKQKHLDAVRDLIATQQPDVACLVEIRESDTKKFAEEFQFEYAYSPFISTQNGDTEGTAILSKLPIRESRDLRYDDDASDTPPLPHGPNTGTNREKDRFSYHASVLTATLPINDKNITIATTHFPVTDHSTPGLTNHTFDETDDLREINHTRILFDRFLSIIRKLPHPLIFTADLNNPRGEYMYDTLAHELVDGTPQDIDSTLDPRLHRRENLKLVVDTIMTSPDIKSNTVGTIEGVSDHKAIVVTLEI